MQSNFGVFIMKKLIRKGIIVFLAVLLFFGFSPAAGAELVEVDPYGIEYSDTAYNPDVGQNGVYLHVIREYTSGNFRLSALLMDAEGNWLDAHVYWDDENEDVVRFDVAYDPASQRYAVVWETGGTYNVANNKIYIGFLDGAAPQKLEEIAEICPAGCARPSIAAGAEGYAVSYIAGQVVIVDYFERQTDGSVIKSQQAVEIENAASVKEARIIFDKGHGNRFFVAWAAGGVLYGRYLYATGDGGLEDGEDYSFGEFIGDKIEFEKIALASGTTEGVTILWHEKSSDSDTFSVTRAVYGAPVVQIESAWDNIYRSIDLAYDEAHDQFAVLLTGYEINYDFPLVYPYGLYIDWEQPVNQAPDEPWGAIVGHNDVQLVYNSKLGRVDIVSESIDWGPVVWPFGQTFEPPPPPPMYHDPAFSHDGETLIMVAWNEKDYWGESISLDVFRIDEHTYPTNPQKIAELTVAEDGIMSEFVHDVAYGNGLHLAVWQSRDEDGTYWLHGRYFHAQNGLAGSAFEMEVPYRVSGIQVFYEETIGNFVAFYMLYETNDIYGVTVDASGFGPPAVVAGLPTDEDFAELRMAKLGGGRYAAASNGVFESKVLFLPIRVDDVGNIGPDGSLMALREDPGQTWIWVTLAPVEGESRLLVQAYLDWPEREIHLIAVERDQEGNWHFEDERILQTDETYDLDFYAGPLTDGPVLVWLQYVDDETRLVVHDLDRSLTVPVPVQGSFKSVKLVPGKSRLHLWAEEWEGMGTGLFPVAIDFAAELQTFGTGGRIAVDDLVKYVRSLNLQQTGFALENHYGKLLEQIEPIHKP